MSTRSARPLILDTSNHEVIYSSDRVKSDEHLSRKCAHCLRHDRQCKYLQGPKYSEEWVAPCQQCLEEGYECTGPMFPKFDPSDGGGHVRNITEYQKTQLSYQEQSELLKAKLKIMELLGLSYADIEEPTIDTPYLNVFGWLLEHPTFRGWSRSPDSLILNIVGYTGSRKSPFNSFIASNAQRLWPGALVLHLVVNERKLREYDVTRQWMCRNLLYQAALRDERARSFLYDKDFAASDAEDILEELLLGWEGFPLVLLFDGLEPLPFSPRNNLSRLLGRLSDSANPGKIRICTSMQRSFRLRLPHRIMYTIDLEEELGHLSSIRRFLANTLSRKIVENIREKISEQIFRRSDKRFAWAYKVVWLLNFQEENGMGANEMTRLLNRVPDDMRALKAFVEFLCDLSKNKADLEHASFRHAKDDLVVRKDHAIKDWREHNAQQRKSAAIDSEIEYEEFLSEEDFSKSMAILILKGLNIDGNLLQMKNIPDYQFTFLLADFASNLHRENVSQHSWEVMMAVHRYGSSVYHTLLQLIAEDDHFLQQSKSSSTGVSVLEKVQMWSPHNTVPELDVDERYTLDGNISGETENAYKNMNWISEHSAYERLIKNIRASLSLAIEDADVYCLILKRTLEAFSEEGTDLEEANQNLHATFQIALRRNSKEFSVPKKIDSLISLTGSSTEAQATTCGSYMQQNWPATGPFLIELLESTLNNTSDTEGGRTWKQGKTTLERVDGTTLSVWVVSDRSLMVEANGTRYALAELAAQLAWLCPNLAPYSVLYPVSCTPCIQHLPSIDTMSKETKNFRTSPATSESVSNPMKVLLDYIHTTSTRKIGKLDDVLSNLRSKRFVFEINFEYDLLRAESPGNCWQELYAGCVLVKGFPVLRRPIANSGLEVPLDLLTRLVGSRYIQEFDHRYYIKAFSLMLVVSDVVDQIVLWHAHYRGHGAYISYLDHEKMQSCSVGVNDMVNMRHIVGWCSNIKNCSGAAGCCYDVSSSVRSSILTSSTSGNILSGCNLSFGFPVSGGQYHTSSPNQQPLSLKPQNQLIFRHLERKFVLFWDTQDKRGWLMNGLRALLHLIRLSIKVDEQESIGTLFVLRPEHLTEPAEPFAGEAARTFLSQKTNLDAKISELLTRANEYELLRDRMMEMYGVFEKAIEFQRSPTVSERWKNGPRSALEGWDIVKIIERSDEVIRPYVYTLPKIGNSWVDLMKVIEGITFFGEGFGELLQPSSDTCPLMPTGKHYIAVSRADLGGIAYRCEGNLFGRPQCISRNPAFLWHAPRMSLEKCRCNQPEETSRQDKNSFPPPNFEARNVSVIWPEDMKFALPATRDIEKLTWYMFSDGAFIFGYNPTVGYYFNDIGPPVKGVPPDPSEELAAKRLAVKESAAFEDSGIGSSVSGTSDLLSPFSLTSRSQNAISRTTSDSIANTGPTNITNPGGTTYGPSFTGNNMQSQRDFVVNYNTYQVAKSMPNIPTRRRRIENEQTEEAPETLSTGSPEPRQTGARKKWYIFW